LIRVPLVATVLALAPIAATACDIRVTDWTYRTFAAGQIVKVEGLAKNQGKTACGKILLNLRLYTKGNKWFGNAKDLFSVEHIPVGGEYGFSANFHRRLGNLEPTEIGYTVKHYDFR